MAEFPAMPLWTDAYLADTGHLTTLEHGAYMLLLMTMWRAGGSLPDDDTRLMRFTKTNSAQWTKIKPVIMEFFHIEGGKISQKRLAREFDFVKTKREKASQSAKAKYQKYNDLPEANAEERMANAPATTPTPTPIKKKEPSAPKKGTRIPNDFKPDFDEAVRIGVPMQLVSQEAAKFRDYWTAKSGKDATKLDWPATWRNWCRNAASRLGARSSPAKSDFRNHQDEVTKSFERAANGRDTENGQPSFLDLGAENFRRGK